MNETMTDLQKCFSENLEDTSINRLSYKNFDESLKTIHSMLENNDPDNFPQEERSFFNKAIAAFSDNPIYQTNENIDHYVDTISWRGHIESIKGNVFYARMKEIENKGTEESAQFDKKEVSEDDKEFIRPGAVFYYSIGYNLSNGTKKKVAVIKFKRNVLFTNTDIDTISEKVQNLDTDINWG